MPPLVTITPPEAELARLRAALKPSQYKQAIWQAVKRTTEKGARQIQKALTNRLTLKASRAKEGVVTKLTRGDSPEGIISIRRRPLPASYFQFRKTKKGGVAVKFRKDRAAITFRHAFFATVGKGGHQGVFTRAKHLPSKGPNVGTSKMVQSGRYKGKFAARFTMREIFGTPLIELVNSKEIADQVTLDANAEMSKQLQSQFNRFMKVRANG